MIDNHTTEQRSASMARIRSSGIMPEERLYTAVRVILGHKCRIDPKCYDMACGPDIMIPSLRSANLRWRLLLRWLSRPISATPIEPRLLATKGHSQH